MSCLCLDSTEASARHAGGRKRVASAGETPCSYVKRPALWAEHLMGPGSSGHGQEEDIPLYDYAFSAASCGPAPKGTPTDVRSCSANGHKAFASAS